MFDVEICKKYVESLIQHDEVERAILVLNNLPAFYRDNMPDDLLKLKKEIIQSICTPHAYANDGLDQEITVEGAVAALSANLRGILIQKEVKRYNEMGLTPHIVDMGPGEYFVPIGLKHYGLKFSYNPIAQCRKTEKNAAPFIDDVRRLIPMPGQPVIFLALEIIEHLYSPTELATECLRNCGEYPERVHLSTPCYTYDNSNKKEWRKKSGLPHLRAYTPKEFWEEVARLFPGYATQYFDGIIMSMRLMRGDSVDPNPLF